MSASPPTPMPMSAAARQPARNVLAYARSNKPPAAIRFSTTATRAPKNRSSSQPTPMRPSKLAPPSNDAQSAAVFAVIPQRHQVRNCSIHADRIHEQHEHDDPEGIRAQAF